MRIETLELEQWQPLTEIFAEEFRAFPRPIETSIVGAYDGDKLAGFVEVDTPILFGPAYVFPEYRGRSVLNELIHYVEKRVVESGRSAYVLAMNPRVNILCQRAGLTSVDAQVWWREGAING